MQTTQKSGTNVLHQRDRTGAKLTCPCNISFEAFELGHLVVVFYKILTAAILLPKELVAGSEHQETIPPFLKFEFETYRKKRKFVMDASLDSFLCLCSRAAFIKITRKLHQ